MPKSEMKMRKVTHLILKLSQDVQALSRVLVELDPGERPRAVKACRVRSQVWRRPTLGPRSMEP